MEQFSKGLLVFVVVLNTAFCKDLHTKEKDLSGGKGSLINLLTNNGAYTNERYARHAQPATEYSTHFVKQMNCGHHKYQTQDLLKKLMKNLKKRLRKYVKTKHKPIPKKFRKVV